MSEQPQNCATRCTIAAAPVGFRFEQCRPGLHFATIVIGRRPTKKCEPRFVVSINTASLGVVRYRQPEASACGLAAFFPLEVLFVAVSPPLKLPYIDAVVVNFTGEVAHVDLV